MNRDAIVSLVAARLNRTDPDFTTLAINEMSLIQAAQLEGAPFLPWFTEVKDDSLTITANVETLAVPSGFIRELDGMGMYYVDPDSGLYKKVVKDDYDNLLDTLDPTSTVPQGYAIIGDTYYFRPVPTQGLTLRVFYNQRQVDPASSSGENNWMKWAPDLFIGALGFVLASTYLQNPNLAQPFDIMRKEAMQRLLVMHEARTHANRDYRMGGTED